MRPGEAELLQRSIKRAMPENVPLRGRFARAIMAGPLAPYLAELTALRLRVAELEGRPVPIVPGARHVS